MPSGETAEPKPSIGTGVTQDMIRVPVAADGSTFGPDLGRERRYTVGAKGLISSMTLSMRPRRH
ncbi:hypothetical protein [Salipiger mangrovisoli]|uniref:hypothetical protein n=1 Tax=Salipiger mangrovisoli TaxID=2865933 RepID=UPI001880DA91|nr:hypothetical protein [Salipiger mangrovisoli]